MTTGAAFASTASTLQLTAATASPGDTVECAVTVTDDSNGSDTMSVTDTVSNTGPTSAQPPPSAPQVAKETRGRALQLEVTDDGNLTVECVSDPNGNTRGHRQHSEH